MSAQSTRRINRGAGHSYLLDGEPCDGVTWCIAEGIPKPALVGAAARETANFAVNHWDELAGDDLAQRLRKIEAGRFEAWRGAGVRGTKVHDLAAKLLGGEDVTVPDELVGYVDACLAFLDEWKLDELAVEVTLINRQFRYMGTGDLLARARGELAVGVFDWKTGASGIWPETALQLAAYAHCGTMLDDDGTEATVPPIAYGVAVHLRGDGYEARQVDIGDDTWRVFLYAQQVARWRARPREDSVGEPVTAPELVGAQ